MAVVACRVDLQIDAILHLNHPRARVHRARVHHLHRVQVLHAQVLHVHPVRIAMAHLQVVAPQVVVTHPIAAHTQVVARRVDRQIDAMVLVIHHVEILHVQVHVHLPIVANAVTVHAIHDQVLIVEIVVQVPIVQQVVHTVTETHVHHPIVHVARILMAAIVQKLAMIAVIDHLRALANAVVVQIAPEAGLLMIAKNVHVAG